MNNTNPTPISAQFKQRLFAYPYKISDVKPSHYVKAIPLVVIFFLVYGYAETRIPEGIFNISTNTLIIY